MDKIPEKFKCSQCDREFLIKSNLTQHYKERHSGQSAHVCKQCGKCFTYARSLDRHMLTHSGVRPHICLECGKGFTLKQHLEAHKRTHTAERPYSCKECGKCFKQSHHLKKHMLQHIEERPQTSDAILGKCLAPKQHLQTDIKTPTILKSETLCTVSAAEDLQGMDVKLQSIDLVQNCIQPILGQNNINSENVEMSIIVEQIDEGPYVCKQCGDCFYYLNTLKQHTMKHTGENVAGSYSCKKSEKYFQQSSYLNKHILLESEAPQTGVYIIKHTGEQPYSCTECEKGFTTSFALKRHILTHSGDRPHTCDECAKSFTQKVHLQSHMRTHTGEKAYSCNTCGKLFTRSSTLKTHMLVHSGERPHTCNQCGKCFMLKQNLETHTRTHTGERPYRCEECGHCFTQSYALKQHMRRHTVERPYSCKECGKCFAQERTLNMHMKSHNTEEYKHNTETLPQHDVTKTEFKPFTAVKEELKDVVQNGLENMTDGNDIIPQSARSFDECSEIERETEFQVKEEAAGSNASETDNQDMLKIDLIKSEDIKIEELT